MNYVECSLIGTVEDHPFFNSPFIAGVSLFRVRPETILNFSQTRAAARALDESEVAARLTGIVNGAAAELERFRVELAGRVDGLARLVADARKLADLPADLAADRAAVLSYVAEAGSVAAMPTPDMREAETVSRWFPRFEGDAKLIIAAVNRFETEVSKVAGIRDAATKRRAELETALARMDGPETAARLAGMKVQRDITRRVPDLVSEFTQAHAAAAAALDRMGTIAAELKGIAGHA